MDKQLRPFLIGEVFHKVELKRLKKTFNKEKDISREPSEEFSLPLINAKNGDNGIMYYGRPDDWESDSFCIDIVNDGAVSTGNVYPQPQRTGVLYNAYMIKPNDTVESENVLIYLAMSLEKVIKDKFSYDNKATWEKVKEVTIRLPITDGSDTTIDYEYMEDYISQIQEKKLNALAGFCSAEGLDNCELSDEEQRIIALSPKYLSDKRDLLSISTSTEKAFIKFKLGKLFTASTGDVDLQQKDINGKGCYFINSGTDNNGIKGKTDRPAKTFPANTLTVDFLGNTFYRDFEYKMATHNHVFSLSGEIIKNRHVGLFLVSAMSSLTKMYSFNDMATWNRLKEVEIYLPINKDGNADTDYMEKYIKAVKKTVFANIVKYKNGQLPA